MYVIEIFAYTFLGSGVEQPWNKGGVVDAKNGVERGAELTPLNVRDGKNNYNQTE